LPVGDRGGEGDKAPPPPPPPSYGEFSGKTLVIQAMRESITKCSVGVISKNIFLEFKTFRFNWINTVRLEVMLSMQFFNTTLEL